MVWAETLPRAKDTDDTSLADPPPPTTPGFLRAPPRSSSSLVAPCFPSPLLAPLVPLLPCTVAVETCGRVRVRRGGDDGRGRDLGASGRQPLHGRRPPQVRLVLFVPEPGIQARARASRIEAEREKEVVVRQRWLTRLSSCGQGWHHDQGEDADRQGDRDRH